MTSGTRTSLGDLTDKVCVITGGGSGVNGPNQLFSRIGPI